MDRLSNVRADEAAWATVYGVDYREDLGSIVVTRGTISTDDIVSGPAQQRSADLQDLLLACLPLPRRRNLHPSLDLRTDPPRGRVDIPQSGDKQ